VATAYRPTPRPKTLTLSTIALVANLAAAGTGTVVQPGIGGNHGSLSSQSASAVQTPAAWPGAKAEYPACEATCPADVYESDGPREGMPVHHENCVHGGAPCRRLPEHVCSLASLWQHTAAPAWPCHPAWPGARRNVGQCPTYPVVPIRQPRTGISISLTNRWFGLDTEAAAGDCLVVGQPCSPQVIIRQGQVIMGARTHADESLRVGQLHALAE